MQTLLQDLRYAARQLARSPGFALTAILSLALAIGATTAVFTVIDAALLHPYPYRDANHILRLVIQNRYTRGVTGQWSELSGPEIRLLRQSPVIQDLILMDGWSLSLTGSAFPEDVETIFLSANGFSFLGDPPLLGRGLEPSDAIDGQEPRHVVVLSYKFWLRHFNGDPHILGQTLQLNHQDYRIVGVAARRFTWYSADVYLPLRLTADPNLRYIVDLRLKPGISRAAAAAALQPLFEQFARNSPKAFPETFHVALNGLNDWVVERMGHTLYLLLAGVGLLLAIGCGNVSILLLARGSVRAHELALRTAIGAARARIVRQLLTESLLLALTGAAVGVFLAWGAVAALHVLLPIHSFAPEVVVSLNPLVLLFCVGIALATGILFGLSPALHLSRPDPAQLLQSGTRRIAGSARSHRTHGALVATQIALTLVLLAASGAAIAGFLRLLHTPLGYNPRNIMSVWVPLRENAFPAWSDRVAYFERLQNKVSQVPGVVDAAMSVNATPPDSGARMPIDILGRPTLGQPRVLVDLVSQDYFSTLQIPLQHGRLWTAAENHNGAPVAVINQTLARRLFPSGDALDHALRLPSVDDHSPINVSVHNLSTTWLQIVGVVADSRNDGLRNPVSPAVYVPWTLYIPPGTQILVRSRTSPLALMHAVRLALASVNPDQQAARVVSNLDTWVSDQPEWQQEHLIAWLFAAFALLALALAAVGLYSVVSYGVAQRTNELGIRLALGAPRAHIFRIVFASTFISVALGVVAGVALTLALSPLLARWVGDNLRAPLLLPLGVLILVLTAALAALVPARRAAATDPSIALRCE